VNSHVDPYRVMLGAANPEEESMEDPARWSTTDTARSHSRLKAPTLQRAPMVGHL
jgi:hypothetical protein